MSETLIVWINDSPESEKVVELLRERREFLMEHGYGFVIERVQASSAAEDMTLPQITIEEDIEMDDGDVITVADRTISGLESIRGFIESLEED